MMGNPLFVTGATALLILLSAFFVVIEFALLGARRHRLEEHAPSSRSARAALRGVNELTIMLAGAQLGITLCTFALGAITKPAVDAWLSPVLASWGIPGQVAGATSFLLSLLFVTFLHLVVGEMAPKSWAIAHPERAATLIGLPSHAYIWPLRPLLTWINAMANRLVAASGVTPVDRAAVGGQDVDTIRHLVEQSASSGSLDTSFRSPLSGALELEQLTIGSLIAADGTPASVSRDATVADVREAATRTGHLRILVEDPDGGAPGVLHVRDTLLEPLDRPVRELARPVFALRASTPVYEALGRFREASEELAAVLDDGELSGVVTLADVVRRVLPVETGGG